MLEDLDRLARQLRRETNQAEEAVQRLRSRQRRAEDQSYASSTAYGQALLRTNVGRVSDRLSKRMQYLRKGGGAVDATTVFKQLKDADLSNIALLTMKICLDVLGKEPTPQLVQLTIPIGRAIETELRLNHYFDKDKDLFKRVENNFHSSTGTRQKATVFRLQFNRAGIEWEKWGQATCHKVGSWCLEGLCQETGWIHKDTVKTGRKSSKTVMRYSQEFLGLKGTIIAKAERLAFCAWPMVCPPVDWSNEQRGGYLTEEIRQCSPMVRARGPLQGVKQGELPIQMLNNLQHQAYRINLPVLSTANWCFDNYRTIGKFRRETVLPLPAKLEQDEPTKEELKAYKRHRREVEDYNAQLEQKNYRTTEAIYVANKYSDEERFWIPWSFDYRSRIYPLVTSMSPQGTDFDKSLLYFAEEGPINEYWLAFQVATTYGLDKATLSDRIEWVKTNTELITKIATDPIDHVSLWSDTSEPWSFLASCIEYHSCCIAKTKSTSGLPCGIDATQSGIQHLSALTLDAQAAAKVNVLPTPSPVDGYRTVAEVSLKYIEDQSIHPYIDRKTSKRCTMCLPYGLTRDSARGYIRDALKEGELDLTVPGRLTEITRAIYEQAIPEVFPGPVEVMRWFQRCAKYIMKTKESIQWTTPSGFVVVQDLRKSNSKRIQTRLMGSVVDCQVGQGWGEPDVKHHVSAIAPNTVHALDAALIQLTFAYWDKPFTVIHDCVMARSCDMEQLAKDIRLHFAEMYKRPVLEEWAEEVGVTIPDSLIKGTLDIEEVNESLYFFC